MTRYAAMGLMAMMTACMLAPSSAVSQTGASQTSKEDQQEVSLTAYNGGYALIRDVRKLTLPEGEVELRFMDVATQIRPETVGLRSASAPGSVVILEQNFEYDLISPEKLMEKYVGKTVTLRNFSTEIGFESIEAVLMSVNGGPVYNVNGEIYLGHPGQVVLPEIPGNLIAKPSLIWILKNPGGEQTIEATYITQGVSWNADYVLTLAKDDATLDIAGWVTMRNESGTSFENTKVKLVAGDLNAAPQPAPMPMKAMARAGGDLSAEMAMPQEETFAEYHLYTLPRRTTLKQNQSKQLALLSGSGVKCIKKYEYKGEEWFFASRIQPMPEQAVSVYLEFENRLENGLGIPLPEGAMRIFQVDSEQMPQFAGEDRIKHTPKDEKVRLRMGTAFDVKAERIQTDYKVLNQNFHETAYEITIRNHKENDIQIDVVEPMPGDWRVIEKSHEFTKKDARTIVFHADAPKDGEVKIAYRVQVKQ